MMARLGVPDAWARTMLCSLMLFMSSSIPLESTAQVIAPGLDSAPQNTYPNPQYYLALEIYREGDLGRAAEAFDAALGRTRRDINGRWIDAIPVHAMLGECFYQAGDLPAAVEQIDAALALVIRHRGWLSALDWRDSMVAAVRAPDQSASWAAPNVPALLPLADKLKLATGSADVEGQLRAGGTFESARLTSIDAIEIMRGVAIASYRRRVIFGTLSEQTEIVRQSLESTKYPPGLDIPVARALIGSMRGCERFAGMQDDELLTDAAQSAVVGNAVHPLTPILLLAAARATAQREAFPTAIPLAIRAAAAASALRQPEFVGEAMMIAVGCADGKTAPVVLNGASGAAAAHLRRGRVASIGALLAASEAASLVGDVNAAQLALSQASELLGQRDVAQPRLAAHGEYLTALLAAQAGQVTGLGEPTTIDAALTRMYTFASGNGPTFRRGGSGSRRGGATTPATPRLFQLGLVTAGVRNRGVGGKAVDEKLNQYAGDPPAMVWRADPVDALAFQTFDRAPMAMAQVVSAVKRNAVAELPALIDNLQRQRFLSTQTLGGRILQIRRMAATEKSLLPKLAADAVAKPPQTLMQILDTLAAPAPAVGTNEFPAWGQRLESLATHLALQRTQIPASAPLPVSSPEDLAKLPKECGLLVFTDVGGALVAILVVDQKIKTWNVAGSKALGGDLLKLLRDIGVTGSRQASRLEGESSWKAHAATLRRKLIPDEFLEGFESLTDLVIVPDGSLWYLPMDLLPLGDENAELLGERVAIRYAPTIGLAVHPVAFSNFDRPTGLVTQLFFAPRDGEANQQSVDQISAALKTPVLLPGKPLIPGSLVGDSVASLAVLGVVRPNPASPLAFAPALYDATDPAGSLAAWMLFPSRVPLNVFLPGYRTTAADTALGDGRELFLTLTAMHCAGVRNIMISRWPVGGESTSILMKEFLQELPFDGPQGSWRRAVQTLRQAPLQPAGEPLLGAKDQQREELTGEHPLFWSGYLIVAPAAPK